MSGYAASAYAWRTVSAYRLSQSDLDKFLVGIFGNVNLFIRVSARLVSRMDQWLIRSCIA